MLIKPGYPSGARPQVFICELISNFPMFPLEILFSTITHQTNCKEKVLILMCGFQQICMARMKLLKYTN